MYLYDRKMAGESALMSPKEREEIFQKLITQLNKPEPLCLKNVKIKYNDNLDEPELEVVYNE